MISNDEYKAIAALDLEPIKVKLMHEESGEGWSLARANAVEAEYRRFLILMKKYPDEETAPLMDVDTFWHYHILDTLKYAVDCDAVFGYFLHHFPYIGLRGEADEEAHHRVGERMKELYEATFGEDYIRPAAAATAFSGVAATAFSGVAGQQGDGAQTAFSGVASKSAFSGVAAKQADGAKTAFSGVAASVKSAFSGVANKQAGAQTAFSGVTAAAQKPALSSFYSERPRLTQAAK